MDAMMNNYKKISIIEDSKHNKFFFYYNNQSIYCRDQINNTQNELLLVNNVNDDFQLILDIDDSIYLVSCNKEKGVIILSYEDKIWRVKEVIGIQGNSNVTLINAFLINKTIHILYAKRLPIANFYNIYHIYNNGSRSSSSSWKKHSITEVYAENLNFAVSSLAANNDSIHMANVWFDGRSYSIAYNTYDSQKDKWYRSSIATLFNRDTSVHLLADSRKVHLLSHSIEDEVSIIFYFSRKERRSNVFEFSCINKHESDKRNNPQFYIDNKKVFCCWLDENVMHEMMLKEDSKAWESERSYKIDTNNNIYLAKQFQNNKGTAVSIIHNYIQIDDQYNILKSWEKKDSKANQYNYKRDLDYRLNDNESNLTNQIPYIIDELQKLAETVKELNERLEKDNVKKSTNGQAYAAFDMKSTDSLGPEIKNRTISSEAPKLKKSNFKENFLKSSQLLTRPSAAAIYVGPGSLPVVGKNIDFEKDTSEKEAQIVNEVSNDNTPLAPVDIEVKEDSDNNEAIRTNEAIENITSENTISKITINKDNTDDNNITEENLEAEESIDATENIEASENRQNGEINEKQDGILKRLGEFFK